MSQDTIFALSSGMPPAGIAVFRISGPAVRFGLETLIGRVPAPRRLVKAQLLDPADGQLLDHGLAVFFPAPDSFTGEDVAELHLHGGTAVVAAAVRVLRSLAGFRLAERGEFTRRALEAGKLDLIEVEGLADLVTAETEAQRRQALRQAGGGSSAVYEGWRAQLIRARAMIEAEVDFADGEDLPPSVSQRAWAEVEAVRRGISNALAESDRGERVREGIEVVILGPPNAGKSSLLNWFARRDAAIVSPEPGTTRDLVEVRLELDGFPLTLTDTAGLREASGGVEQEGIRRALSRAAAADIVLALNDARLAGAPPTGPYGHAEVLRVATKVDLLDSVPEQTESGVFGISTVTGVGLDSLVRALGQVVARRFGGREPALVTRERHRQALQACLAALTRAGAPGHPLEIVAEELRVAGDALARLTGRIDVEDWLDVVFSEFCIGK